MSFTRGEWKYKEVVMSINRKEYIIFTESVNPDGEGEDVALAKHEADARLIAAAPEMYRILCDIQDYFTNYEDIDPDIECDVWEILSAIDGKEARI